MPVEVMRETLRRFDRHRRQLLISELIDSPGRAFQIAFQTGLSEHGGVIDAIVHRTGALDEAESVARALTVAHPDYAPGWCNLGLALQHCGRMAEAIASFRDALVLDPEHVPANWNLSFTLLASGELTGETKTIPPASLTSAMMANQGKTGYVEEIDSANGRNALTGYARMAGSSATSTAPTRSPPALFSTVRS